jgi:hypothetical protein
LRLLNLSSNPLSDAFSNLQALDAETYATQLALDYFDNEWKDLCACFDSPRTTTPTVGPNLNTLIINSCFIDLRIVECILEKLKNLNELHISSNSYSKINFSKKFSHESLKILYFNNNDLKNWSDVLRLGECFPSLQHLVISENTKISDFGIARKNDSESKQDSVFKNVQTLIMNKFNIIDWNCIEFSQFPQLKHIRIQNIPLLEKYDKNQKYELLVGHLEDSIETLNGGKISKDEKKSCELKYLYHFNDLPQKPNRYFELLFKHRAFNISYSLVNGNKQVSFVRIHFDGKYFYERISTDISLAELQEILKKITNTLEFRYIFRFINN